MCARFGLAMHCGFPKVRILNYEPAAFREANGIEQSSRRCRLFSSHVSVILVTIRVPALAQLPFERRLRAEGGPLPECIIFDTLSKQDLHLERWLKDLCEMLTRAREFRDIGGYVAWPRDSLPFRWRNCAGRPGPARDARGSRASCSPKGREKRR